MVLRGYHETRFTKNHLTRELFCANVCAKSGSHRTAERSRITHSGERSNPSSSKPFNPIAKMTFRKTVALVGQYGWIGTLHPELAEKMILAGKGVPVRNGKRIVAVQLPSVPCGERDNFHGSNSLRMHKTEEHEGGNVLTIETATLLNSGQFRREQRTVTTDACRVYALKHSSRVLGEVLSAERRELMAVGA